MIMHRMESLPKLAWLVELRSGSVEPVVYHGPWVEATPTGFIEGVWDGPFAEQQFDQAPTLLGSGAKVVDEGMVFCSATHLYERLYTTSVKGVRFISNSLIFLLDRIDDGFDLAYPNYYFDLLDFERQGFWRKSKALLTQNKNRVELLEHGNFLVDQSLTIQRFEKPQLPAPEDYSQYHQQLVDTLNRVMGNSTAASRTHPFRLLASSSKGYDSTAIAALAQQVGCREALTFATVNGKQNEDDGTEIATLLGLETAQYDRFAYKQLPRPAEAEFCVSPTGTAIPIAAAESQLAGAILLTGRYADIVWDLDEKQMLPFLMWPTAYNRSGSSYEEYRLRVGFLHLPVPAIMAQHNRRIWQISHSAEMKPWSLNTAYNKPIPRRMAEEAGVPRQLFGLKKMASGHSILANRPAQTFHPESWASFSAFLSDHPECKTTLAKYGAQSQVKLMHKGRKWFLRMARRQLSYEAYLRFLYIAPIWRRQADSPLWGAEFLYSLHWGYEQIRDRYRIKDDRPGF